jgi:hypothetical protein
MELVSGPGTQGNLVAMFRALKRVVIDLSGLNL